MDKPRHIRNMFDVLTNCSVKPESRCAKQWTGGCWWPNDEKAHCLHGARCGNILQEVLSLNPITNIYGLEHVLSVNIMKMCVE